MESDGGGVRRSVDVSRRPKRRSDDQRDLLLVLILALVRSRDGEGGECGEGDLEGECKGELLLLLLLLLLLMMMMSDGLLLSLLFTMWCRILLLLLLLIGRVRVRVSDRDRD